MFRYTRKTTQWSVYISRVDKCCLFAIKTFDFQVDRTNTTQTRRYLFAARSGELYILLYICPNQS